MRMWEICRSGFMKTGLNKIRIQDNGFALTFGYCQKGRRNNFRKKKGN